MNKDKMMQNIFLGKESKPMGKLAKYQKDADEHRMPVTLHEQTIQEAVPHLFWWAEHERKGHLGVIQTTQALINGDFQLYHDLIENQKKILPTQILVAATRPQPKDNHLGLKITEWGKFGGEPPIEIAYDREVQAIKATYRPLKPQDIQDVLQGAYLELTKVLLEWSQLFTRKMPLAFTGAGKILVKAYLLLLGATIASFKAKAEKKAISAQIEKLNALAANIQAIAAKEDRVKGVKPKIYTLEEKRGSGLVSWHVVGRKKGQSVRH